MKHLEALIDSLWTKKSIEDCAVALNENKTLAHTKMSAGTLILDNGEEVQVQVIVTRQKDEDSLLGDFEMVEMYAN